MIDPLTIRQLTICAIVGAVVAYSLFRFLRRTPKPTPDPRRGLKDATESGSPTRVIVDPASPFGGDKP